ncbi:MAG: hypothetical protein IJE82_01765 [Alphaproteobacteria bacterium]|nr:hypothetical protein [Alphaproteobacteria bacterium]
MNRLKKFWITFLSFLPLTAGAAAPFIIGGIAGVGVIAGFSIYRSTAPVDMNGAYSFFPVVGLAKCFLTLWRQCQTCCHGFTAHWGM